MDKADKRAFDKNFNIAVKNFNWENTQKVMEFLNWYWFPDKHAPKIVTMKQTVKELYEVAIEDYSKGAAYPTVESGGFMVSLDTHKHSVRVDFIIEYSEENDNSK